MWEWVTLWRDEVTQDSAAWKKSLQNGLCVIQIIFSPGNPKCVLTRNEFISKAKAALDGDPNDFLSTWMPFPVQYAVTLRVNTSELPGRAEGFSGFSVIQFKQRCHSILQPEAVSHPDISVQGRHGGGRERDHTARVPSLSPWEVGGGRRELRACTICLIRC